MKNIILFVLVLISIVSCGQINEEFAENGAILKNQKNGLTSFSKVAPIIDSDDESYRAYEYADSLLTTVDIKGKIYNKDLSKIYSAYTYIFYGMSYTKTVIAISRGDDYSFEELNKTIIPFENKELSKYELARKELASIYSVINFYKVSRMPKYTKMNTLYNNFSNITEELFEKYPENEAYKTASLKNKKLYFMTTINLIIDLYLLNNQNTEQELMKPYFDNLTSIGETLDKVHDDYIEVAKLSNIEYLELVNVCSETQEEILTLLTNEIKILAKGQD